MISRYLDVLIQIVNSDCHFAAPFPQFDVFVSRQFKDKAKIDYGTTIEIETLDQLNFFVLS